ncbi:MAG TPA: DUF1028 domain-containing protein [Baekduia sp.]|uniref:DUF1028 domain-containing protein n=1 Tax=Baekduia sp. TaxID=2600305 RepID=UPI002D7761D1|nr:DUF1028 domain-containing protein [Baekduia sp.]HET6510403.1 DUF1028 domain-containing protein [Baekduia sp.]
MVRRGTYSIVARDEQTGELGAAVESHWFSVGSIVTWARPGVGAVCTQSIAEPAYGSRLLDALAGGTAPADALRALLDGDDAARFRQVAAIGTDGPPAVWTGDGCIAFAGHASGDDFSAQANMMASEDVWPAMAEAFARATGPLARRLLGALRAAEGAGGDARGRQSAAVVVVPASGEPWERTVDLRVEDHDEPLDELGRLLTLHDAYTLATRGDDLTGAGRHAEAGEAYRAAAALAPGNHELLFWAGLAEFDHGDRATGLQQLRTAIAMQPGWRELMARLEPDVAPAAARALAALDQ